MNSIRVQKKLSFKLEVQKSVKNGNFIEGYFTTPDIDRTKYMEDGKMFIGESVDPKAFLGSFNEYMNTGGVVFFNHDSSKIVGKVEEYRIESQGVWVRIKVFNNEMWKLIEEGVLRTFSWAGFMLGYEDSYNEELQGFVRTITEVEIFEITLTAIPANPNAQFRVAKSLNNIWKENNMSEEQEVVAQEATEEATDVVETTTEVEEEAVVDAESENVEDEVEEEEVTESEAEEDEESDTEEADEAEEDTEVEEPTEKEVSSDTIAVSKSTWGRISEIHQELGELIAPNTEKSVEATETTEVGELKKSIELLSKQVEGLTRLIPATKKGLAYGGEVKKELSPEEKNKVAANQFFRLIKGQ